MKRFRFILGEIIPLGYMPNGLVDYLYECDTIEEVEEVLQIAIEGAPKNADVSTLVWLYNKLTPEQQTPASGESTFYADLREALRVDVKYIFAVSHRIKITDKVEDEMREKAGDDGYTIIRLPYNGLKEASMAKIRRDLPDKRIMFIF